MIVLEDILSNIKNDEARDLFESVYDRNKLSGEDWYRIGINLDSVYSSNSDNIKFKSMLRLTFKNLVSYQSQEVIECIPHIKSIYRILEQPYPRISAFSIISTAAVNTKVNFKEKNTTIK